MILWISFLNKSHLKLTRKQFPCHYIHFSIHETFIASLLVFRYILVWLFSKYLNRIYVGLLTFRCEVDIHCFLPACYPVGYISELHLFWFQQLHTIYCGGGSIMRTVSVVFCLLAFSALGYSCPGGWSPTFYGTCVKFSHKPRHGTVLGLHVRHMVVNS